MPAISRRWPNQKLNRDRWKHGFVGQPLIRQKYLEDFSAESKPLARSLR
jgi:hypothetical protein